MCLRRGSVLWRITARLAGDEGLTVTGQRGRRINLFCSRVGGMLRTMLSLRAWKGPRSRLCEDRGLSGGI